MNESEQTLPEPNRDDSLTVETETTTSEPVAASVAPDANVPQAALDITMGDMETDLPAARAESPAAAESEIEIPWGDMSLSDETEAESETAEPQSSAVTDADVAPIASAPAPETPEPEQEPIRHVWYVVHCYSGYENKVKKGLEQRINSMGLQDRIFRVVVPVEREVEIREGQRKNIERRVFPGYILVEMMELVDRETLTADASEWRKKRAAQSDEVWYAVRNTPGVTGFVSSGDLQRPVPLRQEEVDKILKRMESEEPKVHVTFRVGQTVHIIDGPFADFRGNVDTVDMVKGKVRVLVSFFGRETPVELDLLQVEKV